MKCLFCGENHSCFGYEKAIKFYKTHLKNSLAKDGVPVCRLSDTEKCEFLGVRRFGTIPVCMYGEQVDLLDIGYIQPKKDCVYREMVGKQYTDLRGRQTIYLSS